MAEQTPSATLLAAADRIRDLAAEATPGPWAHRFGIKKADETVDYAIDIASDTTRMAAIGETWRPGDARWIAALSPALAPHLEAILRAAAATCEAARADGWTDFDIVAEADAAMKAALALARAVLGSGVNTP